MSKKLVIKADNCILYRTGYGVEINGKGIEDLINNNLPVEVENGKEYVAKVNISIELHEPMEILKIGYEDKVNNEEVLTEEEANSAI